MHHGLFHFNSEVVERMSCYFRCGHCRKFEPIYEEISKEIYDLSSTVEEFKNIRIVRIDATVYTDVANRYDVRGYPTIKFIRGAQIFSYENERSKPAVLEFLRRVNGPALRWIPSIGKFNEIRREHEVFFFFVTTNYDDENDSLFNQYKDLVNRYLSQTYFYATNASIIQQTYFSKYKTDAKSQIFAIKNEGFYFYKPEDYNNNLEQFIIKEKVATFPQVASGNIHDLIVMKKIIIIYGFKEQQETVAQKQKRFDKVFFSLRLLFEFTQKNMINRHVPSLTKPEPNRAPS
jgi:thioredoxin domain-containing protein 10